MGSASLVSPSWPTQSVATGQSWHSPSPPSYRPSSQRHSADDIEAFESVVRVSLRYEEAGENVIRTIDLETCAGEVVLLHADPEVVAADYAALTVVRLKGLLRERGLRVSGKKADLVARLEADAGS